MLRHGALLGAILFICSTAQAADSPPVFKDGNWRLGYNFAIIGEQPVFILKVETKDGKASATKLASAPNAPFDLDSFELKGDVATIKLKIGQRALTFTGKLQQDGKSFRGEFGDDKLLSRGMLTATDATEIPANFATTLPKAPASYTDALKVNNAVMLIRNKIRQAKDVDEKAKLQKELTEAQEKADKEGPAAWKAVVDAEKNSPYAVQAAQTLIQSAIKSKADAKDVAKWISLVENDAASYSPRLAETAVLGAVETLATNKAYAEIALPSFEKIYSKMSDKSPLASQSKMLKTAAKVYKAVEKADALKTVNEKLNAVEGALDKEYLATVPPFKVAKKEGRKQGEGRAVLMELFTGAQCPPCVAADVAFDALSKAYDHNDVILLQYHMHIPGPDPMTNNDTVARFGYYGEKNSGQVRGTPTTLFNGKIAAGGGGGMENSKAKFEQYAAEIAKSQSEKSDVAITGNVSRNGDSLTIVANTEGVKDAKNLKLKVVLTEDNIKYVGGNGLRFHHHVVRHFVGGVAGSEVKEGKATKSLSLDLKTVQSEVAKYADNYAKTQSITFADNSPEMSKSGLKIVVFVQNEENGEVLNSIQLDVPAK